MLPNTSAHAPRKVTLPAKPFANENNLSQENRVPVTYTSAIARKLTTIVSRIERSNRAGAIYGNPSVYDSRMFPWVAELENGWTIIRGELAQLMMRKDALAGLTDRSSTTIGEDRGWTTIILSNYFTRSDRVIAQCPETWRMVQKVPGLVSAMFSVLEPGQRLPPHRGPYNGLLRLHLGLIVPEPRDAVAIRIDGDVHHWEEGRALVFDDTFEHEARNESNFTRVVLFVDFEKPLRFPARLFNRRLLRSFVFGPFVREGAKNQGWWARRFYREAQAMRDKARLVSTPDEITGLRELPVSPGDETSLSSRSAPVDASIPVSNMAREWPFDKEKV